MIQAFLSAGKPREFWAITVDGDFCAIHSGKVGTSGEWQLLENLDEDSAAESAADLIRAKKKAGFVADPTYDAAAQRYFDDPEFGPHPLTSHPVFNAHFTDELYSDPAEDESPFGSDDGADTIHDLQELLHSEPNLDLVGFPEMIVTQRWEMVFHSPSADDDADAGYWSIGGLGATDQAVVATAFGSIKITGSVPPALKELGLQSLRRWLRLGGSADSANVSTMIRDLTAFPAA